MQPAKRRSNGDESVPHPRDLCYAILQPLAAIFTDSPCDTSSHPLYIYRDKLDLKAIIDMSQARPEAAQSTHGSRPSSMRDPQETDRGASSTTDCTNPHMPLPSHWEELKDNDGGMFYANHATRSTSWQRPNAEIGGDGSQA